MAIEAVLVKVPLSVKLCPQIGVQTGYDRLLQQIFNDHDPTVDQSADNDLGRIMRLISGDLHHGALPSR